MTAEAEGRQSTTVRNEARRLTARFSRVGAFNAVSPRDPARKVLADQAYGPDPMQALDVYAPLSGDAPAPMVVFLHGGGWHTGRRQEYAFVGHALASQGFLTLVAGYRLVPQVHYPDFVDDAALAVAWGRSRAASLGGDPDRIAFVGHSAGAYIALKLGLDRRHLEAAGADPKAVRAVVGLSGPYSFLPLRSPASRAAFQNAPDLEETQPVSHVRPDSPPALLIHGGADTAVTPGQSVRMARALEGAGAQVETRIFQTLNHSDTVLALSRTFRRKAPILDEVRGFLGKYLSVPG